MLAGPLLVGVIALVALAPGPREGCAAARSTAENSAPDRSPAGREAAEGS